MYPVIGSLKELWDDYGTEPIVTHTVNLKRDLLKRFETELHFSFQQNLLLVLSLSVNPCHHGIAILKGQEFQDK